MVSLNFQDFYNIEGSRSAYAGENAFGFWFINLQDGERTKTVILLADRPTITAWVEPSDPIPAVTTIIARKAPKKNEE